MKTISSQQQRLVSWDVATTLDVITVQQQQQSGSSSNSEEEDKEKRLTTTTTTTCDDNNDQTRNVKTTRSTSSRGVSTTTTMSSDCNNNNNNNTSTTDDLSHWIASTTTTSSTTSMNTTLKRKRSAHKRKGGQGGEGGRSRGSTTTTTTNKPSHHHLPDDGVLLSSPDPPSSLRSDVYDPLMEKEIVNDKSTSGGDSSSNKNNNNKATPCQHSLVLLSFLTMPDEIQLRIASYLVLQDVRRLFGTSTKLATLFHSNEADLLWKQQVQTIWPHCLAETTHYIQSSSFSTTTLSSSGLLHQQQTNNKTTTTTLSCHSSNNDSCSLSSFYNPQDVKYNMLLQLAHCIVPSCIDDELFPVCRWSRRFQRHVPLETSTTTTETGDVSLLRTPPQPPLQWVHTNKGIRVVQFIGIVGTGDRCIRSNHPWKAPISLPLKYRSKSTTTSSSSLSPLARRVFCWNNSKKQQQQQTLQAHPPLSQSIMHVLPHLYSQVQPPTPPQQDQTQHPPQPGPLSRLFSSNHPNNHNITHDQQNRYPLTTFTSHRRLGGGGGAGGATSLPSNSSVLNRLRRGRPSAVSSSSIMMRPQATPLSSEQPQEQQPQEQILQEDKNHYPRGDRVPPPPVIWKPFVVPFCCSNMQAANGGIKEKSTLSSCTRMVHQNLTPRLVHYFEVTILPASDAVVPPNDVASSSSSRRSTTTRTTQHLLHHQPDDNHMARECVAIGLSRREFSLHTRMPGWDSWSFGYHGDDGGVFYETGHMLHEYGPSFGVDDVIGCGIDYLHHEIFFTKNGNYLGPAWKHLDKCYGGDFYQHSWYPTVGMDTTCLIDCNFGIQQDQQDQNQQQQHRPFCFDLVQYMQQHQHFEALEQIVS